MKSPAPLVPRAPYKADLHLHTRYSDGSYEPAELVRLAKDLRIDTIAVTDHDTVAGVAEALAEGRRIGVRVIPGVEMSTVHDGDVETHLIGLFVDPNNAALVETLARSAETRLRRLDRILEMLAKEGVNLSLDEIREHTAGEILGRMQVAEALVRSKHAGTITNAFTRWLGIGKPAYLPSITASPEECCRLIREAGGVAVLAHPGDRVEEEKLTWAVKAGCRALEAYYPLYSKPVTEAWIKLAKEHDLGVSGGSDCHGSRKAKVFIGAVWVPEECVTDLERRRG